MTDLNQITVISPDGQSKGEISFDDKQKYLDQGYQLPEAPPITVVTPDGKSKGEIPFDNRQKYVAQGYTVAAPPIEGNAYLAKSPDLSNVQDKNGNLLVKQRGTDNILSLPVDKAMPLINSGHLEFKDPEFQALIDYHRDEKISTGRYWGSVITGVGEGIPIVDLLVKKLENYDIEKSDIPQKALSIASIINKQDSKSPEGIGQSQGQFLGTVGTTVASMSPAGLMGEGLLAAKVASAIPAIELSPLASKALIGATKAGAYSLPYIADQLINNQPGKAAETTLLSIGVGALLHTAPAAFNGIIGNRAAAAASELPSAATNVLEHAGINSEKIPDQSSFVRDLLKVAPKLEDAGQGLKSLAAGDHMIDVISKMDGKIDNLPIISKLEQSAFKTGSSEEVNNEVNKIIKSLNPIESKISLSNLQKVSKELASSIDFAGKASEITNVKISALDYINQMLVKNVDENLTKAIESGNTKAVKLAEMFDQAKNTQEIARDLLNEFQQKTSSGSAPELTSLGKVAKNVYSNTLAGAQTKLQNPGQGLLNAIPGVNVLTGAKGNVTDAISNTIKNRSASFDTWLASHPNSWLIKNIDNPKIGTFVALDSVAANNAKLNEIPEFIKNIGSKTPTIFISQSDPIAKALGSEANGLSKQQQLDRLSEKVSMLAGNPEMAQQKVNDLIKPFIADHPEMALQAQQLSQAKIAYLNNMLHSQNTQADTPFQKKKQVKWTSPQIHDIKEQLAAIDNPYVILNSLKTGIVNSKQVAAVQATSPAIYEEIKQTINKEAYTGKAKLNYQQRIAVSTITGQPMDPTLNNVSQLQMGFGSSQNAPQGAQPAQPAAPSKGKTGHKMDSNKMPSKETTAQRLQGT